jgi:integrase
MCCFNYAIDLGLRPPGSNPFRRIKRYRERKIERFLCEAEIGKAAEAIEQAERARKIGPHAAAGLRLALFTGARSGEITAIQWSHVDWERRLIRLPDSKVNEPRTIHLSEAALEVLKTVPRIGPLARDAVQAVNDELGAAMQAAIAKGSPPTAKVVKLRRRRR